MKLLFFPFLGFNHSKLQKQLAGKTVLITGASYGIGECLAESLADTEAHLILVARTAEKLIEVKERVEAKGGRADVFPCDLRNVEEVETLRVARYQMPVIIEFRDELPHTTLGKLDKKSLRG
jgi:FlaA1/EpsC-like NDP-sugar epimerase